MIELIFVIVIIGILAAVAIPKLAATRDDAKISNIVANARTFSGDVTSYYTSQGATVWDTATVASVSNVPLYTDAGCTTLSDGTENVSDAPSQFYLCDERDGNECLRFDINNTAMVIWGSSLGASTICDGVLQDPAIIGMSGGADGNKTTVLGGVGVVR